MQKPHFETNAIRTQTEITGEKEHSTPMYLTSSFRFDNAEEMRALFAGESEGNIYSRYSNPNTNELIEKVCLMEGTEAAFATSTGMAAVFTSIAAFLKQGDHLIASRAVFGSTHQILTQILPRWGITHTYVDPVHCDEWEKHILPETKMILLETPSNPGLSITDLEKAGKIARKHNLLLNVDNCFATPYLQQPAKYGADIITHSATKFMDGQGRVLGGIVAGRKELIDEVIFFNRHTGPAMSPFNAWVISKSLETLAVRMDRHCENALAIARFLESQSAKISNVLYPFLESHPQYELAKKQMRLGGGIVSFELRGGLEAGQRFLDELKMITRSSNLGDTRSIATHPASSTHSKLTEVERLAVNITPGLIRISVGLEHPDDVISDIEQALGHIT